MFHDKYPALTNMLGGYFPPGEYDFADEDSLLQDVVEPGIGFEKALQEARLLLREESLPWQDISHWASRLFKNEQEARDWLTEIVAKIERILTDWPTAMD